MVQQFRDFPDKDFGNIRSGNDSRKVLPESNPEIRSGLRKVDLARSDLGFFGATKPDAPLSPAREKTVPTLWVAKTDR